MTVVRLITLSASLAPYDDSTRTFSSLATDVHLAIDSCEPSMECDAPASPSSLLSFGSRSTTPAQDDLFDWPEDAFRDHTPLLHDEDDEMDILTFSDEEDCQLMTSPPLDEHRCEHLSFSVMLD